MKVLVLQTLPPVHLRAGRAANEFDLSAAAEEIARFYRTRRSRP